VRFNAHTGTEREIILSPEEQKQKEHILQLRQEVFANLHRELMRYYRTIIAGHDYLIPGMIYY
jgi:hypothetical protein